MIRNIIYHGIYRIVLKGPEILIAWYLKSKETKDATKLMATKIFPHDNIDFKTISHEGNTTHF